jgi:hypothetical protein
MSGASGIDPPAVLVTGASGSISAEALECVAERCSGRHRGQATAPPGIGERSKMVATDCQRRRVGSWPSPPSSAISPRALLSAPPRRTTGPGGGPPEEVLRGPAPGQLALTSGRLPKCFAAGGRTTAMLDVECDCPSTSAARW